MDPARLSRFLEEELERARAILLASLGEAESECHSLEADLHELRYQTQGRLGPGSDTPVSATAFLDPADVDALWDQAMRRANGLRASIAGVEVRTSTDRVQALVIDLRHADLIDPFSRGDGAQS